MNPAELEDTIQALGREAKIEDPTRIGVRVETMKRTFHGRHYWPIKAPVLGIRENSATFAIPLAHIIAVSVYELPR